MTPTALSALCRVLALAVLTVALGAGAVAGDEPRRAGVPPGTVVLEGFEGTSRPAVTGQVDIVAAADAVTEGAKAAQLAPNAAVTVAVSARAVSSPGWLKIDTFQPQPAQTPISIALAGGETVRGYVQPGKDTLALPVSVFAKTDEGPWPIKAASIAVTNLGLHPVVLDNIRLEPPAPAPKGAVLLDFGPDDQVVWPGFQHALDAGPSIAWSGKGRVQGLGGNYPDPLTGDFTGASPYYKEVESLTVRSTEGLGVAWFWATHFAYLYSPPLEYVIRANGKELSRQALSPAQMMSGEGLLRGKDQPWTAEWLNKTFAPSLAEKFEVPLKAGDNAIELANSQIAALVICPRGGSEAMRALLKTIEADVARYRRQFVLGAASRPVCDVVPTEEESKCGMMVFAPPLDAWFDRAYVPKAEHRAAKLATVVATGSGDMTALVVVPIVEGRTLSAVADPLRNPADGTMIPLTGVRVDALEAMPVVDRACVYYQPFLVGKLLRSVQSHGVYWLVVHTAVPETTHNGTYAGSVRLTLGSATATVPLEVEVHAVAEPPPGRVPTFGVLSNGDTWDALRSLHRILPAARQQQISRDILSRMEQLGFNAATVPGPTLDKDNKPVPATMTDPLKAGLKLAGGGRTLVSVETALNQLAPIQVGTVAYGEALRGLAHETEQIARANGLEPFAHYVGYVPSQKALPDEAKVVAAVRRASGRPAACIAPATLAGEAEGRDEMLANLEVLMLFPGQGALAVRDAFKQRAEQKTLAVRTADPDAYALGFYAWGIGADGFYLDRIFWWYSEYNAFSFNGSSLLLPNSSFGFEATLAALMVAQGMSDYRLAARCERMVPAIKAMLAEEARSADGPKLAAVDTSALEKVLQEIRVTCDARPPAYDRSRLRSTSVDPALMRQWRAQLAREAGKLTEQLVDRRAAKVRANAPPPGPVIPLRP